MNPFRRILDPSIPEDEMRFVDRSGNEVGRITNIGKPRYSWADAMRDLMDADPVSKQMIDRAPQEVLTMRIDAAIRWDCTVHEIDVDISRDDQNPNILRFTLVRRADRKH